MDQISYPVTIEQIKKFEDLNSAISVSVYEYEENKLTSLRQTKRRTRDHHVNLLLLSDGEKKHYTLIKDLGRLVHKNNKHKCYPCKYCLRLFSTEASVEKHYLRGCVPEKSGSFPRGRVRGSSPCLLRNISAWGVRS